MLRCPPESSPRPAKPFISMPTHEQLDREHEVATSSERGFGLVFATVFALAGAWRLRRGHADAPTWLGIAVV